MRWAAVLLSILLAACANTAPPSARGDDGAREGRPPAPPTGGPNPPQRIAPSCNVDADCTGTPHCADTPCQCVRNTCIAPKDAIDPVIDPAPVPPPET